MTENSDRQAADENQNREFLRGVAACEDLTQFVREIRTNGASIGEEPKEFGPKLEEIARALFRGKGSHCLLTAERGVEPETFLLMFAAKASGDWLPFLKEKRILFIDARHTPPAESRERLVAILTLLADQSNTVAGIAGFETLMRNGLGTNRELLLSALGTIDCQLIGILDPNVFEELFAGDDESEQLFSRIDLPEPTPETAGILIGKYAASLSNKFDLQISSQIARLTTTLCSNYIMHERLPGKAKKVLLRICQDIEFSRSQLNEARNAIEIPDVIREVARASGVPEETLRGIAEQRDYESSLREFIVGQDHAVKQVASELGLIKAGLVDVGKPASVLMFVGQTGTGKTEMAKALSRLYSNTKKLRTYTLGNMVEPHSVSSIIGVPPGYVGHDQGGKIVHDLRSDPHCVILLDEADKAHPDVLQPFLNLFDEGWVRDQRGVQAYANKAIFVLTTNVGQRMIADMAKQGKTPEEMAERMVESLAQIKHTKMNRPMFAPEFLARIKRIIVFQPLSSDAMFGICDKLIHDMKRYWLERREKQLDVDRVLVEAIGAEAHRRNEKSEGKEGGRIVRKLISEYVESPIQLAISKSPGDYTNAKVVRVIAEPLGAPDVDLECTSPESLKIHVKF